MNNLKSSRLALSLALLLLLSFAPALRAQSPPTITAQPLSQYFVPGQAVTFSVTASGSAPLAYQWYFNGTNLPGATDSSFTIADAQATNAGSYQVEVSDADGSTNSAIAGLALAVLEPSQALVLLGDAVTLSVPALKPGSFTYRWYFNGTNLQTMMIATVAGDGSATYSGDGGPAAGAGLNTPTGVALDASGNVLIADEVNNRVRKVDTNGIITTLAGNGTNGFSGDGGPATNASLSRPSGVAFDGSGNLFIADSGNNRIRKVDTNGIISTVAGNSAEGYSGDGGAATNSSLNSPLGTAVDASGNLFIADTENSRIRKVNASGIITTVAGNGIAIYSGDRVPATNSSLNYPTGVAVDASGNLFIADTENFRLRKVDTNGIISTVGGNGTDGSSGDGYAATSAELSAPQSVVLDASGNLFFADNGNNRIRVVNTNGIITTVAGSGAPGYSGDGGLAASAMLSRPQGVAVDGGGNVFVADSGNQRVRKVGLNAPSLTLYHFAATNGGAYSVVISGAFGTVTSSVAVLTLVEGPTITQPQSQYFVAGQSVTFSVTASRTAPFYYQWSLNGTNLPGATNASFVIPDAQAADAGSYQVVVSNAYGFANSAAAILTMAVVQPASIILQSGGSVTLSVPDLGSGFTYNWYVNGTNEAGDVISTVAGNGNRSYSGDGGPATNASFAFVYGVAVDASGNLFIADALNSRIRKVATDGIITTVAGNGTDGSVGDGAPATNASLSFPENVAVDASGNLFIADTDNNRIRKVDTNGIITTVAGSAGIGSPSAVAVDGSGNLFIAEPVNHRVRRLATNAIITTIAGNGTNGYSGDGGPAINASLGYLSGVAVDGSGTVFICDMTNHCIRQVASNGIITTAAGNGAKGFSGDGGPATNASLSGPWGVAVDAAGSLFIADAGNQRIRKVDTNGIITTLAGNGTEGFSGDGGPATNGAMNQPYGVALDASGQLFVADENNERIRKIGSPSAPSLTLSNVMAANGGDYSVVIFSASGSVTSSVAVVTVVEPTGQSPFPPQVAVAPPTNDTIQLNWSAPQSKPPLGYQVQFTTNLAAPNWQNVGGTIIPTNGPVSVPTPANAPQSYYRLLLVQ